MARRSRQQRLQDHERIEREYWPEFRGRLVALEDFHDARRLAEEEAPQPDAPGRRYHSNLAFFLQSFAVPNGANGEELRLYRDLVRRFDARGQLKAGALADVERALDDGSARNRY